MIIDIDIKYTYLFMCLCLGVHIKHGSNRGLYLSHTANIFHPNRLLSWDGIPSSILETYSSSERYSGGSFSP